MVRNHLLYPTLTAVCYVAACSVYAQQNCSNVAGIPPFNENSKCLHAPSTSANIAYGNANFSDNWGDRIQNYSNPPIVGAKQRFRSVFVNQNVNGEGGVAVPDDDGSGNTFYFNPNNVGSTFGIDGDGDGVYEREDQLLQSIVDNRFDEVILYNVTAILENGNEFAADYNPNNSNPQTPFDNIMLDNKPMDWHLARFVNKAKTQYGLSVLAVVPENLSTADYNKYFYDYYDQYARSGDLPYDSFRVEQFAQYYLNKYQEIWENDPTQLTYLRYGEDSLLLPKDDLGRISNIDKALVDILNVNLFEYKVKTGMMNQLPGEAHNTIGTGKKNCNNGFDGHVFEWEWWNTSSPDLSLTTLLQLIQFSKGLQLASDVCYPAHYVVQDEFDDPAWIGTTRTEQQRADLIDEVADRVYLYTYHKNPCDCYWGRANNGNTPLLDSKDFKHKVQLLNNNSYGADNSTGETFVLPVFNAKYHCPDFENSTATPQVYGDGNKGCNGAAGCDYNKKLTGTALLDLPNNGLLQQLGYVENIFQEQYDFDALNTGANYSSNHIFGYSWFKSRLLFDNGFINSTGKVFKQTTLATTIYPNPSHTHFTLEATKQIAYIELFTLDGRLQHMETIQQTSHRLHIPVSGIYVLRIVYDNGQLETQRIVKW